MTMTMTLVMIMAMIVTLTIFKKLILVMIMMKLKVVFVSENIVFEKLAIWGDGWVVLAEYKEWLGRTIQYRGCVLGRVRVLGLF